MYYNTYTHIHVYIYIHFRCIEGGSHAMPHAGRSDATARCTESLEIRAAQRERALVYFTGSSPLPMRRSRGQATSEDVHAA